MPDLLDMIDNIDEEIKTEVKSEVKHEEKSMGLNFKPIKKKPKKLKKSNAIKIKTDNFRTGISNIIGSSKRGKPPILKQELLIFLENHDPIKKSNTWYWVKKNGDV